MWHQAKIERPSPEGEFCAQVLVPTDSPWFQGHFPGNPVVPGIAQLGMVLEVLRKSLQRELRVKQVSRVRFKQMIRPDERIGVRVSPKPGRSGHYAFRIHKEAQLICNGDMVVEPDSRVTE